MPAVALAEAPAEALLAEVLPAEAPAEALPAFLAAGLAGWLLLLCFGLLSFFTCCLTSLEKHIYKEIPGTMGIK